MRKLDDLVASHLEQRLLDPERLEEVLGALLDRREERASRRRAVAAELAKRAAEADGRVKRLYAAIERGLADLDDPTSSTALPNPRRPATRRAWMPSGRLPRWR